MLRFRPPDLYVCKIDLDPLNQSYLSGHDYLEAHGIYCKGGSSGVDKEYNSRMATIYESQNDWANKFNQFWEDFEKPYEQAKIEANTKMLEGDTALAMEKTQAERDVLPGQTELTIAQNEAGLELLPLEKQRQKTALQSDIDRMEALKPVQEKFFSEALDGVNADQWAANAQADASRAFMSSQTATEMAMARRGATPGSGAYSGQMNENAFARTTALGTAATAGRESGKRESFNRLTTAMQMGEGS